MVPLTKLPVNEVDVQYNHEANSPKADRSILANPLTELAHRHIWYFVLANSAEAILQHVDLDRCRIFHQRFLVIWLLDEADVHLDEEGFIQLGKAVVKHRARGGLVIVVAHRHARWARIADIEMEIGKNEQPHDYPSVWVDRGEEVGTPPQNDLFSHNLKPVRSGDLVLVQGANGSGKTTLLRKYFRMQLNENVILNP